VEWESSPAGPEWFSVTKRCVWLRLAASGCVLAALQHEGVVREQERIRVEAVMGGKPAFDHQKYSWETNGRPPGPPKVPEDWDRFIIL
jgi:hypothetical protein